MATSPNQKTGHHHLDIYGDTKRITQIFDWFTAAVLFSLIAGIIIALSGNNALSAIFIAAGIPPVLATLFLVRHKKLEWAFILLALILISLMTLLASNGLGIHQISNLAFPAVLIIASLVTRKRTMVFLTLYTIGCVAWLVFGELSGAYTPTVLVKSVPGDFFSASLAILVTAFMSRLLTETLFQGSQQLQIELRQRKLVEEQREVLIRELEKINIEAEILRESAAAVAMSLNLDETVSRILDQLQRVVPYDSASVQLLVGDELEIIGGRGFPEGKDPTGFRFVLDENDPAYPILRDGLPYVLYSDIQTASGRFKEFFHEHVLSWMAIPLYARGRLIGMFALDGFTPIS